MAKRTIDTMSDTARTWLKRAVAFVVTLGSVAAAIAAIKALWPVSDPPVPEDLAEFTIDVLPQVTLGDYAQRMSAETAHGFRRVQPTEEPPQTPTAGTPTQTEQAGQPTCGPDGCEPTGDTPVTTTEPPTSSSPPTGPGAVAEGRLTSSNNDRTTEEAVKVLPYCRVPGHQSDCRRFREPMQLVVAGNSTDEDGNELDPVVAAKRVVAVLQDTRKTPDQEPIGAMVTVRVELVGFRDRPVLLTWAMWHATDGGRLHGGWLNEHLTYQLLARSDHDRGLANIWVPLPRIPGPYLIDVTASVDGQRIDMRRSDPFG